MVTQLWLQSIRPAFLLWSVFWIVVFSVDNNSMEVSGLQMFFSLLMGMMVGSVVNDIRHAPMSWHIPRIRRSFLIFILVHSSIWTLLSGIFVQSEILRAYGAIPVWMLIYFWFVVGTSVRSSPTLMAPSSYLYWMGLVTLTLWPQASLGWITKWPLLFGLAWLLIVPYLIYRNLHTKSHRALFTDPFMSFFGGLDEKQIRSFREEFINKMASNVHHWSHNLASASFWRWFTAILYESLGYLRKRTLVFNFLSVTLMLVLISTAMVIPEIEFQVFSYFALFWMCMILSMEYPLGLSENLVYPVTRRRRGLLTFSLRLAQILLISFLFFCLVALSRLVPTFELELETGLLVHWLPLASPLTGILLCLILMSLYNSLRLFTKRCTHAFIMMMAFSGGLYKFMSDYEMNVGFLETLNPLTLTIATLAMVLLWFTLHMRYYRIRDIS